MSAPLLAPGAKGAVGVFGEVADPSGADPARVRLGVEAERRVAGPVSAWSAAWGEVNLGGPDPWGYGIGGGLRIRW